MPTDLDVRAQHELALRNLAFLARLQAAGRPEQPLRAAAGKVPDFPPDPNVFKALEIVGRYAKALVDHAQDFTGFSGGLFRLLTTPDGQKLLERLRKAIFEHHDDPTLFRELVQALGGGLAGYGTLQLGAASEAHLGAGIVATTGVALPSKGTGRTKWFSGLEKSGGLIAEIGTALLIGQRYKEPEKLTGQFYGGHASIEVGIAAGLNIYFSVEDLSYEGFSYTVGIGAGFGVAVLSGWELVTSD